MNNQLSKVSTQYRKFSKGQYIEHPQFNEFLDFFDDQDRLSRVLAIGKGILCGFQPQSVFTNLSLTSIRLSQGVAITTDGDLLTLNGASTGKKLIKDLHVSDLKDISISGKTYTHFKPYDDDKRYPGFLDGTTQTPLWELVEGTEADLLARRMQFSQIQALPVLSSPSDSLPLSKLKDLDKKYLLLYLESYEKEIKPCRGVDCDNQGIELVRNLKVLVITEEGLDMLREKDALYPHPMFSDLHGIKKLGRVILEPQATTAAGLATAYKDVVGKDNFNEALFDNVKEICSVLGLPYEDRPELPELLTSILDGEGFQYAYDVMKDLTDTYTEIMEILPKSFTKSLPGLLSFPKHIMLGKLTSAPKWDPARHQFYNSPILDDKKITSRVELLLQRFNEQVQRFRSPLTGENRPDVIKVTPSQALGPLSNKAIPFYYDLSPELVTSWSHDKTGNRTSNTNQAYDISDEDLFSQEYCIQNPLAHNTDKKTFYRIEGHIGDEYKVAFEKIKRLQKDYNLGFDIGLLSLTALSNNKDLTKAYFPDYVEKHPGLEHRAGVMNNGTFLLVYKSETDKTVIADFCLPYRCCTPKEKAVKLSLPVSTICGKAAPLLFSVTPINGVVKANAELGLKTGVVVLNGQYFFDPSLVDPTLYGREIDFTVNDRETDCVIKVVAKADINVVVDRIAYPVDGSNATAIAFTVSGANYHDYDYEWDFQNNGGFVRIKPDANGKVFYKMLKLNTQRIPAIRVKISGNGCSEIKTITNWYTPLLTIDSIGFPNGSCCEDISLPPIADAGAGQTIQLPVSTVSLSGSSSSGTSLTYSWAQTNGPTIVSVTTPTAANTTVTGLAEGTYEFTLTVTDDNSLSSTAQVIIVVNKAVLPPTFTMTRNITSSGDKGVRTQIFEVGPGVMQGNRYQMKAYNVTLTVIATKLDTPATIAGKLKNLISTTTVAQWQQSLQPPIAIGTPGFPPTASVSGSQLTVTIDVNHSFIGSAAVN